MLDPAATITALVTFLERGGPAMWAIFGLSVLTLTLILWKIWRFSVRGVWSGAPRSALEMWRSGQPHDALAVVVNRRTVRGQFAAAAMQTTLDPDLTPRDARDETTRRAKGALAEAAGGLRAIELIATIAPLLGLFGTVLGMIAAFQALQEAGSRADPGTLAGGIWEALLTTAAGRGVAIPAAAALVWVEAQADRLRRDLEDIATQVHTRAPTAHRTPMPLVAE